MATDFSTLAWKNPMDGEACPMDWSPPGYWSGLPCPPPGNLPKPGIEPTSLMSPALAVLCKFWQLYGGVMVTSSKRAYAIPKSTAPRAPVPAADHC
ncbi:hypothetical protein MG293_000364 [Ovis ammon polii]|uniref:Uncharacterized protein n=1 Tax=Ovis ammon polii TaxID=230172 RepID=A0AAD4YH30_OVIAM|nr:hypothetical protein MG293_000364 [Ovis ammon polii]